MTFSSTGKAMNLQRFLASNEKLAPCECEECEELLAENLAELRERFPSFDFQLNGVVFLARLTDSLGIAVNHPRTDIWVARLVVDGQVTLLQQDELNAASAVRDLLHLLLEVKTILAEDVQQFLVEYQK